MAVHVAVHVVLPSGVDDPAAPSGGNRYDRRVCAGLADAGHVVLRTPVAGAWPRPTAEDRRGLAAALAAISDRAVVLLDGLVACAAPDVVVPQADRLRLAVLVHLPLADETGLAPADAAALDTAERRTLQAAAAVIATSETVAHGLVRRHGLVAARVHHAAPGADPAPPARGTDGGTRLICVASVTPRKGHDLLVDALAQLTGAAWTCVCAGPLDRSPEHAELVRRRAAEHGLEPRLRWAGPLSDDDLAGLYATADLLILPSRAEPYGMVITEVLARGVPVLATAVDGVPEALGLAPDGALPGLLVPAGDPAAFTGALRAWLTESDLRHRARAAAARRRAALRGWPDTVAAVAAVLDKIGAPR